MQEPLQSIDSPASEVPSSTHALPEDEPPVSPIPPIRILTAAAPFRWLASGWHDLLASRGQSLFYGLCFAGFGGLLGLVFASKPEYVSALACGFLLVGPFLALGLYDFSRRLEQREAGLLPTLIAMHGRWGNVGILAVVLAVILMIWARASLIVIALFAHDSMPDIGNLMTQVSLDHLELIVTYLAVGLVFAVLVFAFSWVAIPLMLDRDTDAITSMITSFAAMSKNPLVTTLWAALIVILTVIGFATWYLGLIVIVPVIGHATWHAYRDTIGEAEREPVA